MGLRALQVHHVDSTDRRNGVQCVILQPDYLVTPFLAPYHAFLLSRPLHYGLGVHGVACRLGDHRVTPTAFGCNSSPLEMRIC